MHEAILALRWYLVVQAFALAALPLCLWMLRHLPDKGYSVSKPFALVVTGWVFWLMGTLGWVHNTAGGIIVALVIVVVAGIILHMSQRLKMRSSWGVPSFRSVLSVEVVFAVAFVCWCVVRAYMPRIETAGGEKWMEIAFLRAILRSSTFPPHDPWMSGFAISYYYFGYIIVAMLTRLSAISASIAFNLGIATLFALTCTGTYGLVSNLVLAAQDRGESPTARSTGGKLGPRLPGGGGLLGVLLVCLMGNMEALFEVLHARGVGSAGFWEWLDIARLADPPVAIADGRWVPDRFIWWWQASRVVRDYTPLGGHQEVIDEFPGFSFLLGDMHPHVLGLPVVLLLVSLALNLFLRALDAGPQQDADRRRLWAFDGWEFALYGVCLGGLGILNTWDFPIYLFIVAAAYALARRASDIKSVLARFFQVFVPLLVVSLLLYYPFWRGFQSQARGVIPNLLNGTRLPQLLVMFGPLLLIAAVYVAVEAIRSGVRFVKVAEGTLSVTVGIVVVLVMVVVLVVSFVRSGIVQPTGLLRYVDAYIRGEVVPELGEVPGLHTLVRQRVLVDPQLLGPAPELTQPGIVARAALASPVWTAVGLVALTVTVVHVLRRSVANGPKVRDFVTLLMGVATLLVLGVEFVYVRDHFGTRMNTIFKFYFQAWVLWGVAGAFAIVSLPRRGLAAQIGVLAVVAPLIAAGLLFPALAIPRRAVEYGAPPTLDGAEYLARSHTSDFLAIDWLNQHVEGTPVILEAPGRGYEYEGRVSAHTGLPTVLGWAGHEWQWRGSLDEQNVRKPDIDTIYTSTRPNEVLTLLDEYDISYVYVGPVERGRYPIEGLTKFETLMRIAYQNEDVTIYVR